MLFQYPETHNVIQGSPTEIDLIVAFTWVLKFYDTFTATDGTPLTGHTPSPTNLLETVWYGGDISIVSNRLSYSGS